MYYFITLHYFHKLLEQVNSARHEGKCVSASVVLWEKCREMLVTWLSNLFYWFFLLFSRLILFLSFDLRTLKVSDHLKSVVFDSSPLPASQHNTQCRTWQWRKRRASTFLNISSACIVHLQQFKMASPGCDTGTTMSDELLPYKVLLTRRVFGLEQTCLYEILFTGPLGTSECAAECLFLQTCANVL